MPLDVVTCGCSIDGYTRPRCGFRTSLTSALIPPRYTFPIQPRSTPQPRETPPHVSESRRGPPRPPPRGWALNDPLDPRRVPRSSNETPCRSRNWPARLFPVGVPLGAATFTRDNSAKATSEQRIRAHSNACELLQELHVTEKDGTGNGARHEGDLGAWRSEEQGNGCEKSVRRTGMPPRERQTCLFRPVRQANASGEVLARRQSCR